MDIYEALAGSVPSEEFYLQNNPLFRSGASVFQAPLPHATSNSEAIFGPLIQGLAGGALVGFGRDQAHRDAFTDAQANPLLNSLSAYAPGATMPEDWNPTKAKSDALLQALNMQQKQAEALQQIKEQSELVRAMLPYSPLAAQAAGDKKAAELMAERGGVLGGISPDDQRKIELDFTTKLTTGNEAQKILEVQTKARNVLEAIQVSDPIRAATAIYNFAKILDPDGVVRKEDGSIVANPGGPAGQLASLYNTIMQEGQLTKQTKDAMREIVPDLVNSQYITYETLANTLKGAATKQGAVADKIGVIPKMDLPKINDVNLLYPPKPGFARRQNDDGSVDYVPLQIQRGAPLG